jgi:thiamine biosynthesis lipoprotein
MSRIAISLCGEGRGHATRIGTLVERLEADHDILVFTSNDAWDLLSRRFATGHPRVRVAEIPGIVFEYTDGRLDVMRSIATGLDYQARVLGPLVDRLIGELDAFGAELAVADFEPGLPRAAVHREVEDALAAIDRAASTWRDDSDASRVNRAAAGEWIPVSDHLVSILEAAREIHDRSGGAFDVTAPGAAGKRPVGMRHVETRRAPPAVRTTAAGVAIDLGGIGPGYAVDVIGDRLVALGSAGHLVCLGGEVRAWGAAAPGRPWRVRLAAAADRVVDLADGAALGTSSVRPGRAPVDPRTGRQVGGPPRGLTARADSCARADAWAVAALVLGLEPSPEGVVVLPAAALEPIP